MSNIKVWVEGWWEWLQQPVEGSDMSMLSLVIIAMTGVMIVKALKKHVWEPNTERKMADERADWVVKCAPADDPKPPFKKGVIGSGTSDNWNEGLKDIHQTIVNHMVYGPAGHYWGEMTRRNAMLARNVMVCKQTKK